MVRNQERAANHGWTRRDAAREGLERVRIFETVLALHQRMRRQRGGGAEREALEKLRTGATVLFADTRGRGAVSRLRGPPNFSPDGSRVVFTSDRTGHTQVYEVRIPG